MMEPWQQSKRVGIRILCGGSSSECEVSILSGQGIYAALSPQLEDVELVVLSENSIPVGCLSTDTVALPIIHGTYGEDGRLCRDLEVLGIEYAGSGLHANSVCFDKFASLGLASLSGIRIPDRVSTNALEEDDFARMASALGLPFILKPRYDGSSIGLFLINSRKDFQKALPDHSGRSYIAERYIAGFDLTVGVLDGKAQEVVGIRPDGDLYDFEHKYTRGKTQYDVPAKISDELRQYVKEKSTLLYQLQGCRDFARMDFRIGKDNSIYYLETNTLPGMTPTSLFPKSAMGMGIPYEELVMKMIQPAINRYFKKSGDEK